MSVICVTDLRLLGSYLLSLGLLCYIDKLFAIAIDTIDYAPSPSRQQLAQLQPIPHAMSVPVFHSIEGHMYETHERMEILTYT